MKLFLKEWSKTIAILSLILTFGFVFRFISLTILPIFADEAIYVRWAQVMASEPTLRFLPLSDGKQPLYMWILMFIVKYFNDPLFIGRLISVFAGLSTTIGIFVFSYIVIFLKKTPMIKKNKNKKLF
jgi:predicted membrane-bound mannosyltransferase